MFGTTKLPTTVSFSRALDKRKNAIYHNDARVEMESIFLHKFIHNEVPSTM